MSPAKSPSDSGLNAKCSRFVSLVLAAATSACVTQPATDRARRASVIEHVNLTDDWPYPFSGAVRAGNLLYLSGQLGTELKAGAPTLVGGGVNAETAQAMENIQALLVKCGSSLEQIVECRVMLMDMNDWPAFNAVYTRYFPGPKPARSAWGVTALALGGHVEISCIANAPAP